MIENTGSARMIKYPIFLNPFVEFSEKAYMHAAITVPVKTDASRHIATTDRLL